LRHGWHLRDPLEACRLFRVLLFAVVRGDCAHVYVTEVLGPVQIFVERVWRMDDFKFCRCIAARVLENDGLSAGVFWQEVGDVVGFVLCMSV